MTPSPNHRRKGASLRRLSLGGAGLLGIAVLGLCLGGCASSPPPAPTPAPAPAPAPSPQPSAAPPQVATPTYDNWMDAPRTPGDWSFSLVATGALAQFGTDPANPLFGIECVKPRGVVVLHVPRASGGELRLRTETLDRTLPASDIAGGPNYAHYALRASDSLLDAMAFSKGRFAASVSGGPTYYLPAWPEVTRVVEECRR